MTFFKHSAKRRARAASLELFFLVFFLAATINLPPAGAADETTPDISEIRLLRSIGKYDEAIKYLQDMINDESSSEELLRDAYNEIISAYIQKGNPERARSLAKEALMRFYDLEADPRLHPEEVAELYADIRKKYFSSVHIATDPPKATVYKNGTKLGDTPLDIYLPVGPQTLEVRKDYFRNETIELDIKTGETVDKKVKLSMYDTQPSGKIRFGIKLGFSRVSIGAADGGAGLVGTTEAPIRFTAGLLLSIPMSSRAVIQVEGRFVQLGNREYFEYHYGGNMYSNKQELVQKYLAFPFMLKYYVHEKPAFYIGGGMEIAFHISSEFKTGSGKVSISDQIKSTNESFLFSAGTEIGIGSHYLLFAVDYYSGLSDVWKDGAGWKTRELRISSGLIF